MIGGAVRVHPLHPSLAVLVVKDADRITKPMKNDEGLGKNVDKTKAWSEDKDIVIESLLEALDIHRVRRKDSHTVVGSRETTLLHALALEYKHRCLFGKAMTCLNEALFLVDEELQLLDCHTADTNMDAAQSIIHDMKIPLWTSKASSTMTCKKPTQVLMEEKSRILSTMGNIFKLQKNKHDAIKSYNQALSALANAGYADDSSPVTMILRLIHRLEQPHVE